MTNKRLIPKNARGFTLIETMVAILLLSTAIAGPLTIASKGLSTSLIAKDQIGAFNLAQDGMEFIRFARDTNKLSGGNWLTGGGAGANSVNLSPCESANGCYVDSLQSTVNGCSGTCPVMNFDSTNHFYCYAGAPSGACPSAPVSQQNYIRTITITTPVGTNSNEATVTVVVQWKSSGGITHSVTLREDMFDWQ